MIKVENFSKRYEDTLILKDINLSGEKGKTLVIIGKSGCGKSTLLRHIAGLEDEESGPVTGAITLGAEESDKFDILKLKEKERVKRNIRGMYVGMLFQNSALFDFLNVRGNLLWPMEENLNLSYKEMNARIEECMNMVDIDLSFQDRDVNTLSGGERKRIALARALVLEPKILLYDEPTTGLDPPTAQGINRMINRLRDKKGITSVVTTHDMWSAEYVADKIAMIQDRELKFVGTYEEALKNKTVRGFVEREVS